MNIKHLIQQAVSMTPPGAMRTKALKSIQWRLYCPQLNLWAGLSDTGEIIPCASADDPRVQTFDGRDNEDMKIAFYTRATGIQWETQCVS